MNEIKNDRFNYKKYFSLIKPTNQLEIYNRWIFAFCSIHVNWKNNIKGYMMLKDKYWTDKKELEAVIRKSPLGLHTARTEGIYEFTQKYLADPSYFKKKRAESWSEYETRLVIDLKYIGRAKVAFAIELMYPNTAQVVCTDVHILRWGGEASSVADKVHLKVKQNFIKFAIENKKNPVEMRWRMWDKIQGETNPRYWSYVFEK